MTSATVDDFPIGRRLRVWDQWARQAVTRQLGGLSRGQITLCDASNSVALGEPHPLHVTLCVHRPRFFREAVLGGTLGVAESYVRGDWDCDDLTGLIRIFVRNLGAASRLDLGFARLAGLAHRVFHACRANTRTGSRRNIAAHYDLGNAFYRLWLDDTLTYSSGMFLSPDWTMREASIEKLDRVCRKLALRAEDEVLEIGGGWGGFALHAAARYGCRVTTTTIARQQFEESHQRIVAARLSDRVMLLEQDYRDLSGQFDKLASIEMVEAVGHRSFDRYFRQCSKLLRPDGSLVLQAIVMPERGYSQYLRSVDFIQRYIFPGGCLPSLAAILESVGRATDLRLVHAEDFAPHYAETLRRWRRAFHENLDQSKELGYSEEFLRLWHYYLCYCEAAFEERYLGVMQLTFDKPMCRRDPLRLSAQAAATEPPPETPKPATAFSSRVLRCAERGTG